MKTAKSSTRNTRGFTLIELLIVITILAILATIVIIVPLGSLKKGRDARRESDIKQYQTAIEVYASKNTTGLYPSRTSSVNASSVLCPDLGLTTCPEDPLNSQDAATYTYKYESNGSGSGSVNATIYRLWAKLETSGNFFVACSNGKTGIMPSSWVPGGGAGSCPL